MRGELQGHGAGEGGLVMGNHKAKGTVGRDREGRMAKVGDDKIAVRVIVEEYGPRDFRAHCLELDLF